MHLLDKEQFDFWVLEKGVLGGDYIIRDKVQRHLPQFLAFDSLPENDSKHLCV